ncbi:putative ring finger-containing protein [Anaeramoeba flamelloides]|uniref:Ring finger-containing protein n=1 Tax=Anaeramoeba flamelloides TaxID=1746091 RepID=A0ABQ8X9U7_9EUKA|nr:putative ring finger-containing protein [Anaeramoeba flamelloides]
MNNINESNTENETDEERNPIQQVSGLFQQIFNSLSLNENLYQIFEQQDQDLHDQEEDQGDEIDLENPLNVNNHNHNHNNNHNNENNERNGNEERRSIFGLPIPFPPREIPLDEGFRHQINQNLNVPLEIEVEQFFGSFVIWFVQNSPFLMLLVFIFIYENLMKCLVVIMIAVAFYASGEILQREVSNYKKAKKISLFYVFIWNLILIVSSIFLQFPSRQRVWKILYFSATSDDIKFLKLTDPIWTSFLISSASISLSVVLLTILIITLPNFLSQGHCILSYSFLQNFSKIYRMVVPISIWYLWFIESKNTVFYKFLFFTYLATKVYVLLLPIKKLFKGGKNLWHKQFSFGRYSTQQELDEFAGNCSICIDQFVNPVTLNPCNHIFCENCITQWFTRSNLCPLCRVGIETNGINNNSEGIVDTIPIII